MVVGDDYSLKVFKLTEDKPWKLGISVELNDVVMTEEMFFLQKKWNQLHFHVILSIKIISLSCAEKLHFTHR